jgi:hypothetical protein
MPIQPPAAYASANTTSESRSKAGQCVPRKLAENGRARGVSRCRGRRATLAPLRSAERRRPQRQATVIAAPKTARFDPPYIGPGIAIPP